MVLVDMCFQRREGGKEVGRAGYLGVGLAEHGFLEVNALKGAFGHDGPRQVKAGGVLSAVRREGGTEGERKGRESGGVN